MHTKREQLMFGYFRTFAAAGVLAAFTAPTAHADGRIIGLVDGTSIVTIDPASRKVTSTLKISGADMVAGIDVRPADGMLYGVTGDGTIVTIDPSTGQAVMKSKLSQAWKKSDTTTFDFNPAADRLRLMSAEGASWRINHCRWLAQVQGWRQDAAHHCRRLHQFPQGYQDDHPL
jgi:hypothetical protein